MQALEYVQVQVLLLVVRLKPSMSVGHHRTINHVAPLCVQCMIPYMQTLWWVSSSLFIV